ncbi:MAG: hypothetical protein IKU78_05835 [Paludibacteraceae bacterium]|nr:hypothetical protein [Paludibacteraceae bacterium]
MKKSLKNDAQKVLASYSAYLEPYVIQNDSLACLLSKYPSHTNKSAVATKVKLLNLFYSTGIMATNAMAEHIFNIKDIDARLACGDKSLVGEIAHLQLGNAVRNNYSFATKYCAYHQPDKYPIYDSMVAKTFATLFSKGFFLPEYKSYTKTSFAEKLKDYDFYVKFYDYFMDEFDLKEFSYREVDAYIWGALKIDKDFDIKTLI